MLVWSHGRSITPFDEQKWGLQAVGRVEEDRLWTQLASDSGASTS